jgi:hypothetical protein
MWKGRDEHAYIAQIPVPVPISTAFYKTAFVRGECIKSTVNYTNLDVFINWCHVEFSVDSEREKMVAVKVNIHSFLGASADVLDVHGLILQRIV